MNNIFDACMGGAYNAVSRPAARDDSDPSDVRIVAIDKHEIKYLTNGRGCNNLADIIRIGDFYVPLLKAYIGFPLNGRLSYVCHSDSFNGPEAIKIKVSNQGGDCAALYLDMRQGLSFGQLWGMDNHC